MRTDHLARVQSFMGSLEARLVGLGPDGTAAFAASCALEIPVEEGGPSFVNRCRQMPLVILRGMAAGQEVRSKIARRIKALGLDPNTPNFANLPPEADLDPAAASIFAALSHYQKSSRYAIHAVWLAFDAATKSDSLPASPATSGVPGATEGLISKLGELLAVFEDGGWKPEKAAQALRLVEGWNGA